MERGLLRLSAKGGHDEGSDTRRTRSSRGVVVRFWGGSHVTNESARQRAECGAGPWGWVDGSGWGGVYKALKKSGYAVTIVQEATTSLADDVATTKRDCVTERPGHSRRPLVWRDGHHRSRQ